ncbi:envelope protein [Macroglossus bat coronavirus]|uniref:Small envelope protein n=4 Tax=Orthocoronavirinae TaxID=2501931 RepID=A0A1B3Q5W9_9BETC|nr:small envelope protein [Rousettus bat coronavirus]QKF94916.1 envelope protein [Rousettus bat coronavirus GCCDC1]UMZ07472.1 small envelope protein [Bat coronavirus GCCDC1]URD31201.1 envelope protein [Macroglossus bat coronavirus]WCC63027.1 envelope protein [Bat Coronavirus EsYN17]WCC63809.1 envelope protein [Bat Coronavirus EsYN16]WCC63849.1 envelope protein [Bat Coronavirus EsYN20]
MYELVGTDTSVLIANVLVLIVLCVCIVIVGCAVLLILQFIVSTCTCFFTSVCKPTVYIYNKFKYDSLSNEQEELLL